jgi:hypothetical protein
MAATRRRDRAGTSVVSTGCRHRRPIRLWASTTPAARPLAPTQRFNSDADKGIGWVPPDTTQPSLIVDSSTGNFRYWLFLREAVDAKLGQQLGERIRKALGCGHDTGNVVQPYRVAGTVNYPNNKKIACAYTAGLHATAD